MITRKEYEKLPKPPEGMWLTDMQDMADELKKEYMTLNTQTRHSDDRHGRENRRRRDAV